MNWFLIFLSFVGLMLLKCALVHYTMKLAKWYKDRNAKPKKKYKDIFDYDFMEDYESGEEEEDKPENKPEAQSEGSTEEGQDKESQRESKFQMATKKLLDSIKERREKTAAALFNSSKVPPSTLGSQGVDHDPKEFLKNSKYYAYLKDYLNTEKADAKKNS